MVHTRRASFLGFLLLLALVFQGCEGKDATPKRAVVNHIEAMMAGDDMEAMAFLAMGYRDYYQEATALERSNFDDVIVKKVQENAEGNEAKVAVRLMFKDGHELEKTFYTKHINGVWQLQRWDSTPF